MNDTRLGGLALILGAICSFLTLTFHPAGGGHRVTPAQFEALIALVIGIHALAISGLPVSFLGALALTRRIDSPFRFGLLGLTIYGFGLIAALAAATMSGLVMPQILRRMVSHDAGADQWQILLTYTHAINQGFAQIHVIAFSLAILAWSAAILKTRNMPVALAVYGLLAATFVVFAIISGVLNMELHGFRITTFVQALWFLWAGVVLWRFAPAVSTAVPTV
jgi:hypothetical protein